MVWSQFLLSYQDPVTGWNKNRTSGWIQTGWVVSVWFSLIMLVRCMDPQSDWDQVSLEAGSTPWTLNFTFVRFLLITLEKKDFLWGSGHQTKRTLVYKISTNLFNFFAKVIFFIFKSQQRPDLLQPIWTAQLTHKL